MNRIIKNNKFLILFLIYLLGTSIFFLIINSLGYDWFNHWFFDKFFVFQFVSVVIVGLALQDRFYNALTYIRIGNRRKILKNQLLRYYEQGFIYLNIMFIFIILGGLLTRSFSDSIDLLYIVQWYIHYLLGIILLINLILCLKWSNNSILSKYSEFLVFLFLYMEIFLIVKYLKIIFNININIFFSWIFYGGLKSYFVILFLIIITTLICVKLSDRRDFL
ncbi:hypothetical protein TICRE_18170 [Tissierella creatinophila DSM 6911]|uniref:ABC-2 family transporter protein n=1 Tax=Tissierella creatinophila DSM 6911 TaxID=1123403 RepID=A0A1U7M4H2_TISCR|nr:hypothetical protein TICRE_18170 [Tissierella creatinophila DSM 6911]